MEENKIKEALVNDFNISESDWIPRVAAWTIDALSQMKVLPMEKKVRTLAVSERVAKFPCALNSKELKVFYNHSEVPVYDRNKVYGCTEGNDLKGYYFVLDKNCPDFERLKRSASIHCFQGWDLIVEMS